VKSPTINNATRIAPCLRGQSTQVIKAAEHIGENNMKQAKSPWLPGLLAIAVTLSSPLAMAQYSGWYGGGNVGQGRANIDDDRINSNLFGQGFTSVIIEDDDRDFGYKLFGGYQFGKFLSVEGGYLDLGKYGYTAEMIPAGTVDAEIRVRGLNLDLVGYLPITDQLSAFARAGVNHAKVKGTFMGTGLATVTTPTTSERDTNYKFGFGLQYFLSESFGVRAEAERYRINDSLGTKGDVDLFSVGLVYRFGATAAVAQPVRQQAAAPAPQPVPAPAPAPVRDTDSDNDGVVDRLDRCPRTPAGVTVDANGCPEVLMVLTGVNFAYDSSQIDASSVRILDEAVSALNEADSVRIRIVGHTDSRGSEAYNQSLSVRRANAVRDYFVSKGISAARLSTSGEGESRPTASNNTDDGRFQNRRVELHVVESSR